MPQGFRGWALFAIAQTALTLLLKLIVKLVDNALVGWGDDQLAALLGIKSPSGAAAFDWALPFGLAVLILWLYHLVQQLPYKSRRARYQEKEISLTEAVLWLADQSAWGRWQRAQAPESPWERHLLNASSFLRMAALNGDLPVRGSLKESVHYENIDRDFWRSAFPVVEHKNSILKLVIRTLGDVTLPEYDTLIAERKTVETIWPKNDWNYDWRSFLLSVRTKLKGKLRPMAEISGNDEVSKKPEAASSEAAEAPSPAVEAIAPPTPSSIDIAPRPEAPEDWGKLFAIGDEGKSVWLRFLPDTKEEKADALLLIVYGHKVLLNNNRVGIHFAHAAVQKTVSVSPSRSYAAMSGLASWKLFGGAGAILDNEDYSTIHLNSSLKRVGLSKGGMYELTAYGEKVATDMAADLIRRA